MEENSNSYNTTSTQSSVSKQDNSDSVLMMIEKAANAHTGVEAQQWAQAAFNAANALLTLNEIKHRS